MVKMIPIRILTFVELVSFIINLVVSDAISISTPSGSIFLNSSSFFLTLLAIFIEFPPDTFSSDKPTTSRPLYLAIVSISLKLSSTLAISLSGKLNPSREVSIISLISFTSSNSPVNLTLNEWPPLSRSPPGIFLFFIPISSITSNIEM